jgi:membrane-bound ClpP family serine protease
MTLFDIVAFVLGAGVGFVIAEAIAPGYGWLGGLLGVVAGFLFNVLFLHKLLFPRKRDKIKKDEHKPSA